MLIGELRGAGKGVPGWAAGCTRGLFLELIDEVNRDMAARGLPYGMDLDAGVLSFTPAGLPPQELSLCHLVHACRWKERDAWSDAIKHSMDRVIRTRVLDAITLDQLATNWNLAAEWLRVRFHRECLVRERSDCIWWRIAPGLTPVLEYGLPHIRRPVPPEHLLGWGKAGDELFWTAVQNLRQDPKLLRRRGFGEDWGPVEFYRPEDLSLYYYSASHLLFLEEYLDPVPSAGVVVAVPTDSEFDVYLLADRANVAYLRKLAFGVGEEYLEAHSGVSPHLYWWRDGVFTLLSDPATDEVWPPAEFLAVLNELANQGR